MQLPGAHFRPHAPAALAAITVVCVLASFLLTGGVSLSRQPIWADEFNGPAGAPPDPNRWSHEVGGSGWGNQELQYYTDRQDNAALDGKGHLVITARADNSARSCWYGTCRYTSAKITTYGKFSHLYGRYEARMRLPDGPGLWAAFWLQGDNFRKVGWPACGEIDVVEHLGNEERKVYGSLHGPGHDSVTGFEVPGVRAMSDGFHIFAVDWRPDSISFSVDGRNYRTEPRNAADRSGGEFERPFYILLDLAVGGQWPGEPDYTTRFPQSS